MMWVVELCHESAFWGESLCSVERDVCSRVTLCVVQSVSHGNILVLQGLSVGCEENVFSMSWVCMSACPRKSLTDMKTVCEVGIVYAGQVSVLQGSSMSLRWFSVESVCLWKNLVMWEVSLFYGASLLLWRFWLYLEVYLCGTGQVGVQVGGWRCKCMFAFFEQCGH